MPIDPAPDNPATAATPQAYRNEYARRMNRVLNYIDTHLDETLNLEKLAEVANFSRFYFHRVFLAWMGETLGDYARRRRLEKAAFRLSCGDRETVLETALATGFGSGEAFARAFKLKFGCTPSAWRKDVRARMEMPAGIRQGAGTTDSNLDQVLGKFDQTLAGEFDDHDVSQILSGDNTMDVRIVNLPSVRVAYHRRIGPYGPGIGQFWHDTVIPWMQSHDLFEQTCYGVGYDDPGITPPNKCRYDACVEVPEGFQAGRQADVLTLPGGRYAVTTFKGQPATIAEAWMRLTREWLPSSGQQCDDRPCFEMFSVATASDPASGEFSCEICIPVRAL